MLFCRCGVRSTCAYHKHDTVSTIPSLVAWPWGRLTCATSSLALLPLCPRPRRSSPASHRSGAQMDTVCSSDPSMSSSPSPSEPGTRGAPAQVHRPSQTSRRPGLLPRRWRRRSPRPWHASRSATSASACATALLPTALLSRAGPGGGGGGAPRPAERDVDARRQALASGGCPLRLHAPLCCEAARARALAVAALGLLAAPPRRPF